MPLVSLTKFAAPFRRKFPGLPVDEAVIGDGAAVQVPLTRAQEIQDPIRCHRQVELAGLAGPPIQRAVQGAAWDGPQELPSTTTLVQVMSPFQLTGPVPKGGTR